MNKRELDLDDYAFIHDEKEIMRFIKSQDPEEQGIFMDIYECPQTVLDIKYPTPEMKLFAIGRNWKLIKNIKQDPEVCYVAVIQDGSAIRFVNDCFIDEELVKAAYFYSDNPAPFEKMEQEFQTYEICEKAVRLNPMNLKHVRDSLRTPELCWIAVEVNALAIQYVGRPSEDLINYSLDKNGLIISKILQNRDRCQRALNQTVVALEFIREEYLTQEMVDDALARCPESLQHVPKKFQNPKNCLAALNKNEKLFRHVEICKKGSLSSVLANLNQLLIKETIAGI